MVRTEVSVSVLASVNKVVRLKSRIRSRIRLLSHQWTYFHNSNPGFRLAVLEECDYLQSLLNRLDNYSVVCNSDYDDVLRLWNCLPPDLESHCIALFGCFTRKKANLRVNLDRLKLQLDFYKSVGDTFNERVFTKLVDDESFSCDLIEGLMSDFKSAVINGRKCELIRRLMLEVEYRFSQGWYFIFSTLTCDNESLSKVFPPAGYSRSSAFTDYVRSVDRLFGQAAFGSFRRALKARASGDEFHTYFAVVEKGSKNGRLHIHILHCFKSLPVSFSDPNYGSIQPYLREVDAMRRYWKFGKSSPIAVRFSAGDAYARSGWRWPVVQSKKSSPFFYTQLQAKPFQAVVAYIGKYITKSMLEKEVGCIWRTRMSRNLGKEPIKKVVDRMSLKEKMTLLRVPRLVIDLMSTKVPKSILKRLVLKTIPDGVFLGLFRRAWLSTPISFFKRIRDLIHGTLVSSRRSFGITLMPQFRVQAVFDLFPRSTYVMNMAGPLYV